MDVAAIQAKYGVTPPQLIDVKSLMGDASDNIPGVAGIGEKTALSLVQKFGSLAGVYEHIEDKAIKPKQRENLVNHRQDAEMSLMLGTIRKDAPIETDPARYTRSGGDSAAAAQLLADLEMHKLAERWGLMSLRPQCPRPIWSRWRHSPCRWFSPGGILLPRFHPRTETAPGTPYRISRRRCFLPGRRIPCRSAGQRCPGLGL